MRRSDFHGLVTLLFRTSLNLLKNSHCNVKLGVAQPWWLVGIHSDAEKSHSQKIIIAEMPIVFLKINREFELPLVRFCRKFRVFYLYLSRGKKGAHILGSLPLQCWIAHLTVQHVKNVLGVWLWTFLGDGETQKWKEMSIKNCITSLPGPVVDFFVHGDCGWC